MTSAWNPRSINWDWEAQFAQATDLAKNAKEEGYSLRPFYYYALPVSSLPLYNAVTSILTKFHGADRQQQLHILAGILHLSVDQVSHWMGSPVDLIYAHIGVGAGERHRQPASTDSDYHKRKKWYLERVHQLSDCSFASALYDQVGGDEGLFLVCWVLMLDDGHRRVLSKSIDFSADPVRETVQIAAPTTLNPAPVASEPSEPSKFDRIMTNLSHDMQMIGVNETADAGEGKNKKKNNKKKKKASASPSPSPSPAPSPAPEPPVASTVPAATADKSAYDNTPVEEVEQIDEDDYDTYAYSEVDDSKEFQELLEQLMGLFPRFARYELALLMKTSDSIEDLIEYLCVESESLSILQDMADEAEAAAPKVYDEAVLQLKEVFPNVDIEALEQAFDAHHKDIATTTEYLLRTDVNENADFLNFTTPSQKAKRESVETVAELLDVTPDLAREYMNHKGNQTIVDAIIEIILWHKPTPPSAQSSASSSSSSSLSRVQRGGKSGKPRQRAPQYKYRPQSSEAVELKEWYNSNPKFRSQFPMKFMVESLIYFSGEVQRVVGLAVELVSMHLADKFRERYDVISKRKRPAELTPQERLALAASADQVAPNPQMRTLGNTFADAVKVKKPQDPSQARRAVDSHRQAMSHQFTQVKFYMAGKNTPQMEQLINAFKRGSDLDLHGLRLAEAVDVTRKALTLWWQNELHSREQQGQLHKYGSKAQFAGSVKVITGRGLHSEGGVSVIRKAVDGLLRMGNYTFESQVGAFVVTGKRI
ncbi:hypothetical protein DIURU_004465 [Diutina rugosa]|uniref:Smr domain-containing protein n=1 Tax=Diutina rugosa TaxID=5481 RepID=A0A642UHG7_DIURU|nr:uncharacterized protein DIURU_004465 [Diutina rugosa]KAA8899084.1 hypothetical protein DIURU_004465 [Diutina rugosa]